MKKPLGTHARHLPRYRTQDNAAVDAAVGMERDEPTIHRTTAAGDTRKLRGIPAIGYGVAGHITGTAPHLTQPHH